MFIKRRNYGRHFAMTFNACYTECFGWAQKVNAYFLKKIISEIDAEMYLPMPD